MTVRTPIVMIIFRRPDVTQQVFEQIAKAQPRQLFVIADGPRNPAEAIQCEQARAIIDQVDWPCKVFINYAETNMGLRQRITSGLDWVFDQVDRAIILEDDCLPHPTFFPYCEELLTRYANDSRVMHISGNNFWVERSAGIRDSYYFITVPHVWGWATWRRAWHLYQFSSKAWLDPQVREQALSRFSIRSQRRFWREMWARTSKGQINSWAYQWAFTCVYHQGLCAMPYENQVSNLGMGALGTHTKDAESKLANIPTLAMSFPLMHPSDLVRNKKAEQHIFRQMLSPNIWQRIQIKANRILTAYLAYSASNRPN